MPATGHFLETVSSLLRPPHPSPGPGTPSKHLMRICSLVCSPQSDSMELSVAGREGLAWQVLGSRTTCQRSKSAVPGIVSEEEATIRPGLNRPSPTAEYREDERKGQVGAEKGVSGQTAPPSTPLVQIKS